jgi:uncharacterized protein (TIGR00255 family)
MTGFADADGSHADTRWRWEVRSVNGRGLDMRLRLPPGFEAMEPAVREAIGKAVSRGSLNVTLTVERPASATAIRINEDVLAQVMAALDRLRATGAFAAPRPEAVLAIRGVLESGEPVEDEAAVAARNAAMLASLREALDKLGIARSGEGGRLADVIAVQIAGIERITHAVAASPSRTPEAIRQRLADQIARLMGAGTAFDEQRLVQEAALLATKADVEEELKRLEAHVAAARELLAAKEPVGRKLDFLAQEFNREANTLCSKANDVEITRLGLELKTIIDQMREQVANIE